MKIGILHGPNLNRLGVREPDKYGKATLDDLYTMLQAEADTLQVELDFFQSNSEGEMIDKIHYWADNDFDAVIANPGAYTHTSIALRDAYSSTEMKFVEVHISNIYKREEFRHTSYTAPVSVAVISGLGLFGYISALRYLSNEQ